MRPPKFNFIPERQLIESYKKKDPFFTCSIYSNGQLVFNDDYTEVYSLDSKFIRFYIDKDKRTLSWKILKDTTLEELNLDAKQLHKTKKVVKVFVSKTLQLLGWEKGESYKKLPIKNYILDGDEINYVELPDIERPYNELDEIA